MLYVPFSSVTPAIRGLLAENPEVLDDFGGRATETTERKVKQAKRKEGSQDQSEDLVAAQLDEDLTTYKKSAGGQGPVIEGFWALPTDAHRVRALKSSSGPIPFGNGTAAAYHA